jgi:hypothetical protein
MCFSADIFFVVEEQTRWCVRATSGDKRHDDKTWEDVFDSEGREHGKVLAEFRKGRISEHSV